MFCSTNEIMQHAPKRFRLIFAFGEGAYGEEGFEFFSFFSFLGERKKRNQFCWMSCLLNDN